MKRYLVILMLIIFITSLASPGFAKRKRSRRIAKSKKTRVVKHRAAKKNIQRKPAGISSSHVDFDDLMIEGQNKKSSAIYFLERMNKGEDSRVKKRSHFRNEILESL